MENDIQLIEKKIKKIPRQKIFSVELICKDYSVKTVKYVLNQLRKKKEIGVISHDLYFRPGKSRYLPGHPVPPGADKIIKAVSKKTGEIISASSLGETKWNPGIASILDFDKKSYRIEDFWQVSADAA